MKKLTKFKQLCALLGLFICLTACEKTETRHYDLLEPEKEPEMDITAYGVLAVNRENSGGKTANEGSPKVVDNDYKTKFLINPYVDDLYLQLSFPGGIAVGSYILASANDAQGRDPKDWTFAGSNDGTTWTTIDTKQGYLFTSRDQKVRFDVPNKEKYRYYRLSITAIRDGSGLFQLAEWRVNNVPE